MALIAAASTAAAHTMDRAIEVCLQARSMDALTQTLTDAGFRAAGPDDTDAVFATYEAIGLYDLATIYASDDVSEDEIANLRAAFADRQANLAENTQANLRTEELANSFFSDDDRVWVQIFDFPDEIPQLHCVIEGPGGAAFEARWDALVPLPDVVQPPPHWGERREATDRDTLTQAIDFASIRESAPFEQIYGVPLIATHSVQVLGPSPQ